MTFLLLADAKAQCNIPSSTTTYDTELQGFVDAAQTVAESIAGTIVQRTITAEAYNGGNLRIILRKTPVISIQSITEYVGRSAFTLTSQPLGSTADNYGYELTDANAGVILRRSASGTPMPFLGGEQGVIVSYTAGYATTPPAIRLGALICVQTWWESTQQGFGINGTSAAIQPGMSMVAGYAVPNYALELFATLPSSPRRIPGIA
jgi:hypothetical protein